MCPAQVIGPAREREPSIGARPGVATLAGATAHAVLGSRLWEGRVLAVVGKATYLEGDDGQLFWVSPPEQPAHPRAVLYGEDMAGTGPGARVRARHGEVSFQHGATIDVGNAPVWAPTLASPSMAVPLQRFARAVGTTLLGGPRPDQSDNLGVMLPAIGRAATGEGSAPVAAGSPFVASAVGRIDRIVTASLAGRQDLVMKDAAGLIGLGEGLTPSGDDFVGGLFFAARHVSAAYPHACPWDAAGARRFVERVAGRTNRISRAILRDFADGMGPQPLHKLMEALLTGAESGAVESAIAEIAGIGHSSGWDMLTGTLVGMLPALGRSKR